MTTNFDFSSIEGLNKFWDGSEAKKGWGGGKFNIGSHGTGKANIGSNVDMIFQGLVGRNADPSGRKYWVDKIESGVDTYGTLADTLKIGAEYTGQQDELAANPNATAADLKKLGTSYVSPFHAGSGSVFANWEPGDPITLAMARAGATTESNPDGSQKLDADGNYIQKSSYHDQTNKTVGDVVNSIYDTSGVDLSGIITGEGNQNSSDILALLGLSSGDGDDEDPINPTTINPTTTTTVQNPYDDSALKALIASLQGDLSSLTDAFGTYKTDMMNMWNNANWGAGSQFMGPQVQGVRTQNELPGWGPRTGGTAGFFGRGNRFGLTTGSLNL